MPVSLPESRTVSLVNVYFDVDYTMLSVDGHLRRGTLDVITRLVDDGHKIHVWSGEGKRWHVVRTHGLEPFVSGVFEKPITDYANGLIRCGVDPLPDFIIDDYPQIVGFFGGYHCPDFYTVRDDDDEMEVIYSVISEVAESGVSASPRWRPTSEACLALHEAAAARLDPA
jgi:hypothetical protein